ncbi:hypothetical protein BGX34_002119 [Mortierella sp. NVP85]|nr:hypothetical protein BGX34_002119 [Mortierella sp. NVP85]
MRPSRRFLLALSIAAPGVGYVAAQPQPVGATAFARVGGTFFINGGATHGDNLIPQFWGLDLTRSWSTTSPAWKDYKVGPYNAFHTAGYSADNSTFITFGRDTGAVAGIMPATWLNSFDIKSSTWTTVNPSGIADNTRRDFYAVTNPTANQIYVVGGNAGPQGTISSRAFTVYDVASKTTTETLLPTTGAPTKVETYAAVWIAHLSAMLMIGGQEASATALWMYTPATNAWSSRPFSGQFANNRISPCAASNWDGSTVAVFGGFTPASSKVGDPYAYILDTKTWTWSAPIAISGRGRGYSACTIVGDQFIVWGGHYDNESQEGGVPSGAEALVILNLSTRTWATSYTPTADLAAMSGGNGGAGPNGGGSDNNTSGGAKSKSFPTAAIGGIAAAVVILLLVAGFLLHRRNKRKNDTVKSNAADYRFSKDEESSHANHAHTSLDGPPPRRPPPPPEDLSPALYDFESPSQNGQPLNHKQRTSVQSTAYAPHDPYRHPSPEMVEAHHPRPSIEGYSSHAGYSNFSTPSNPPLAPHPEGFETPQFSPYPLHQQQQQRPYSTEYGYGNAGSVYYPPPPPSVSPPPSGTRSPPPGAISSYLKDDATPYFPYKVPAEGRSSPTVDQYHDGFAMKDSASYVSDFSTRGRRPLSGPQGGSGYGSVYEPSLPGAPQSIRE